MKTRFVAAMLALSLVPLAGAGQAQPLGADQAQPLLYPHDRVEVARHTMADVSPEQVEILMTVARTQRYFAALAYAPTAGIIAEPTVMAANYHNPEAARTAALAQCNARRQGGAPCALAIEVRPAGWQARPLSLSADASEAFERDYRGIRNGRAMAVSATAGTWAIAQGASAESQALAACNADTPPRDCQVVLRD